MELCTKVDLDTHGARAQDALSVCRCTEHLVFYALTFVANGVVVSDRKSVV